MFTNEDIARYYDLSETHYRRIWKLDKNHSLHYGYWDERTKNFKQALLRINEILAAFAEIKPGEKILDAGCGVGGSSAWLAKEKNCKAEIPTPDKPLTSPLLNKRGRSQKA